MIKPSIQKLVYLQLIVYQMLIMPEGIFFNDYYSHFVETVKLIKEDNRTLIIKTHPTSSYYNEEDFIFKQLKRLTLKILFYVQKILNLINF